MARSSVKEDSLWQISVATSTEAEEAVAALLERLFGQSSSVYLPDESTEPVVTVFATKPSERALAKREALEAGLQYIVDSGLNIGPAKISMRKVRRRDWAESWKKYFTTIEIGRDLLIKPSWSRRKPKPGQAVVVLDPGLSFGTGQHPTTAFCLEQITVSRVRDSHGQSFLDIGTGSGLLAIAAVKLGYHPVRAIDHDPVAVRVARQNAKINSVTARLTITHSDLTRLPLNPRTRFCVIAANLIDSLLIEHSKRIIKQVHPDGKLVLSGILDAQFPAVQKAYEAAGLKLTISKVGNGWRSGTFVFNTGD
jgi:ribosomal protein L11 methyltransferase